MCISSKEEWCLYEIIIGNATAFWLILLVAFTIIEAATVQLVSVWFAVGALGALAAVFAHADFKVQIIVFIIVSLLSFAVTRPLVKKFTKAGIQSTNADRCLNKTAVVVEEIDNLNAKGQVKVNGNIWSARSADGSVIPENTLVKVLKIEGVKVIVEVTKE